MSVSIPITIPTDEDGFLRRECPHCERQFKWVPSSDEASSSRTEVEAQAYHCPLCGESAGLDAWWTKQQAAYATQVAKAKVLGPEINEFQSSLRRLNRPGGSVRVTANSVRYNMPAPLTDEPNDMRRVEPQCHPTEPVKVPDGWQEPVYCLICGNVAGDNH